MGLFDGTPLARPVTCAQCGREVSQCGCPRGANGDVRLPKDQQVRVQRERSRGSWMTTVTGFDASATDMQAMLKSLKSRFATGGSIREDAIELRGDHRDALVAHLKSLGYPAKSSGG